MTFSIAKTLSFIVLALISTSCFNKEACVKLDLSKEESSWFANYKNGDTVFFKNELGEIDTFVVDVSLSTEYSPCNRFELGPYIYASMSLTFNCLDDYNRSKNDKNLLLVFDKIGQDNSDVNSNKRLEFFELETQEFQEFSKFPIIEISLPKGNKKIKSYLFTSGLNCSDFSGQNGIMDEFAISKELGLMWYRTSKDQTYQRVW